MVEYLYNAIRATAGNEITISAVITNENNNITENCCLWLHDKDKDTMLAEINGIYNGEEWTFTIPAEVTKGLKGRYWYCIRHGDNSLCFKQPMYLA
jgi:hypothetical protein